MAREETAHDRRAAIDRSLELVDSGIRSIRSVASELRPTLLDDVGLLPALRAMASGFEERSGVRTGFEAPEGLPELSADAELALYRAMQEGLANVARHSKARRVWVTVRQDDAELSLRVEDDGDGPGGAGAEDTTLRMGLLGMRERLHRLGGEVRLTQRPEGGCSLDVRLPVGPDGGP